MIFSILLEVMDKEPTIIELFSVGIFGSILSYFFIRWKWWLVFIIPVYPILYFIKSIIEINDTFVGEAILNEAGWIYHFSVYFLTIILVISIILGIINNKKAV